MDYKGAGFDHLEVYLNQPEINPPTGNVMLTKVIIPHKFGREVFERLELMGVTATHLYDSHEGAAADVINAYSYGRRTAMLGMLRCRHHDPPALSGHGDSILIKGRHSAKERAEPPR